MKSLYGVLRREDTSIVFCSKEDVSAVSIAVMLC